MANRRLIGAMAMAIAVAAGAGLVIWRSLSSCAGTGAVVIENKSGNPIQEGTVSICGHRFSFGELSSADYIVFPYRINCEASYAIEIVNAEGSGIRAESGYVTPGVSAAVDVFSFTDGEIRYNEQKSYREIK